MIPPVVYLAHPVRGETFAEIERNLENARAWIEHLALSTNWAINAAWIPYVETLDETDHRERGLRDNLAILSRCDAIVLVGGRVTPGMQLERDHAETIGLHVIDLTAHGFKPPIGKALYPAILPLAVMR